MKLNFSFLTFSACLDVCPISEGIQQCVQTGGDNPQTQTAFLIIHHSVTVTRWCDC